MAEHTIGGNHPVAHYALPADVFDTEENARRGAARSLAEVKRKHPNAFNIDVTVAPEDYRVFAPVASD